MNLFYNSPNPLLPRGGDSEGVVLPEHYFLKAERALIHNQEIISPAVLEIKNGIIAEISQSLPSSYSAPVFDLKSVCLLPGFVNAHCHLELTAIGPLPQLSFVEWIKALLEAKKTLTLQKIQEGIKSGINMLAKSGVTTIFDHVSFDTPLPSISETDLSVVFFGEVLGVSKIFSEQTYEKLKETQKRTDQSLHISPHSVHAVAPKTLKQIFDQEPKPFSIHLAESEVEQQYFQKKSGALADLMNSFNADEYHCANSAITYLKENQYDFSQSLLIHGNYIDDTDILALKSWKDVCVVHCPGSHAFFQHQSFPFAKYFQNQIAIALGTDSITSNQKLNFLFEIQEFLQNFPQLSLTELMPMLTTNAARACQIKNIGEIRKGYRADLIGFASQADEEVLTLLKTRNKVDVSIAKEKFLVSLPN